MSDTHFVRLSLSFLAAVLLSVAAGCSATTATKPAANDLGYHGVEPDPAPARPQFVLTDTNGRRYDFQAETAGHPTLMYFGYTNCPDLCPTAMADVASALRQTTPALRAATKVIFITTDPKRDTAFVLRRWLNQFSPTFVGLLGTPAQLAAAQTATGITPAFPDGVTPTVAGHPDEHVHAPGTAPHRHFGPLGYAVSHSAVTFGYSAANVLPVIYPGGVTPQDIAADLPLLDKP